MVNTRLAAFVATELVAGLTTASLQAQAGASPKEVILGSAAVVGALGVLWAVVRFFLRPMLHNWFFAVMTAESERTAGVVIKALDATDDTRAVYRRYTDRVYHDKIARDTETYELADANRDRLVFLEESQSRMGEALAKDMAGAMREFTKSNEQQTGIMRDMQREIQKLSEATARLDERFNAVYDGPERRQRPRG